MLVWIEDGQIEWVFKPGDRLEEIFVNAGNQQTVAWAHMVALSEQKRAHYIKKVDRGSETGSSNLPISFLAQGRKGFVGVIHSGVSFLGAFIADRFVVRARQWVDERV